VRRPADDPAAAAPERKPRSPPFMARALRHRNFQLFFGGQFVSLIGTWMQSVAQAWLVYRLTGSSLLLARSPARCSLRRAGTCAAWAPG